jgi:hypothetical protein
MLKEARMRKDVGDQKAGYYYPKAGVWLHLIPAFFIPI